MPTPLPGAGTQAPVPPPRHRGAVGPRALATLLLGIGLLTFGIALLLRAELGVGSWQVFETGLMAVTGASFGVVAVTESLVVLAIAWWWLDERPWIATVLLALGGIPVNIMLGLIETPATVAGQSGMLVAGTVIITVGLGCYLGADLGASAQDSLFVGFYRRYGVRPAIVRWGLDLSLVLVGFLLGGDVGLGTILITIGVAALVEPAMRLGHRLSGAPLPAALARMPETLDA